MGTLLSAADEYTHPVGPASNWNESRYVDFFDPDARVGGWFRLGNRPNEGRAEMSACLHLPGGAVAFMFDRPSITGNELEAGGQSWQVVEPWVRTTVRYAGPMLVLDDPWALTDPKSAFTGSPRIDAEVELTCQGQGLPSVMGWDQDHIDLIFLPGQADFHYQHLVHVTGSVRVGDRTFDVDGRGGKDHSWGPRNWHAKRYFRWLIMSGDDDHGFMLVRGVGPTKQTCAGFAWEGGSFTLVRGFEMRNSYAGPPHYELTEVQVVAEVAGRTLRVTGVPQGWVPLRHRQPDEQGRQRTLRIVKSPTEWLAEGRRVGVGSCEYHDLLEGGRPVGLGD